MVALVRSPFASVEKVSVTLINVPPIGTNGCDAPLTLVRAAGMVPAIALETVHPFVSGGHVVSRPARVKTWPAESWTA